MQLQNSLLYGLLATTLCAPLTSAQSCELVADINTTPAPLSSWPGGAQRETPVEVGGVFYFRAWTVATGMELFRTTGTAAGTALAADIVPGPDSSDPRDLTEHGGLLYFTAQDPVAGRELWVSNGTPAGTFLVKDIGPGSLDGQIAELTSAGSRLFFIADDGATGLEIWSTDGTSAGTSLVADLEVGPGSPEPAELTYDSVGLRLYFSATLSGLGRELAAIDTVTMAARTVKDIVPGPGSSNADSLVMLGSKLLFRAVTPNLGVELWVSDGTAAGTQLVKDINPGQISSSPSLEQGAVLAGELFFRAYEASSGTELWKTDGTAAGTMLVADVNSGPGSAIPKEPTAMGSEVFFMANQASGVGQELFAVTSAPGSLRLVKDIAGKKSSSPRGLTASGNQLFFVATNFDGESTPWVSDGTAAGTKQLLKIDVDYPADAFAALPGGGVIFSMETSVGVELMTSDGTAAGTVLAADIEPALATGSSSPAFLTALNGQELYFSASTSSAGRELWHWSAAGGVQQVVDLAPGSVSSTPAKITPTWLGDHSLTFFSAIAGSTGRELWATDGTPGGTYLVKDIKPGSASSKPTYLAPALGRLFFVAKDPVLDESLWVTDGTSAGTFHLSPPGLGATGGQPRNVTPFGDRVLFTRDDINGDRELWSTDGTLAGTSRLIDLNPTGSSSPDSLTRLGDKVVFTAISSSLSGTRDVFLTDGTAAGTVQVPLAGTPPTLVPAMGFGHLNGKAYTLIWSNPGLDLWEVDPSIPNMRFVSVVSSSPYPAGGYNLTTSNGKLFFQSAVEDSMGNPLGYELVVSDGTAPGTHMVVDLAPGPASSYPVFFTPANGGVYFAPKLLQSDGVTTPPVEIFFSDGTAAGTYQVCSPPPGNDPLFPMLLLPSAPANLTLTAGSLFWSGNDPHGVGRELFRMPQPGAHTIVLKPSGSGQRIESNDPILGTTLTVTGTLASPVDVSLLVMSAPVAAPHATLVAFGSAAWVDPASLSVLTATTSPSWTYSTLLPATPALAGAQFTLQSWTLKGPTALPAETSNGLTIVLGS